MRKGWAARAALGGAALVLWAAAPGTARADVTVTETGWWTRSSAPPSVPDGGIAVGSAPDGALTVAAFRVDVESGATEAELTLTEAGGQGAQLASLQACTTGDTWAAAKGDPIDQAPKPDCPDQPVTLTRADDGTWTVDLLPLMSGKTGQVSVMLVPAPSAVPGVSPAYQLAFQPPAVSGATTGSATAETPASDGATSSYAPSESYAPSDSGAIASPAAGGASPSFVSTDEATAPETTAPPAATPPTTTATTAVTSSEGSGTFRAALAGGPGSGTHVGAQEIATWLAVALIVGSGSGTLRWAAANDRLPGLNLGRRPWQPPTPG